MLAARSSNDTHAPEGIPSSPTSSSAATTTTTTTTITKEPPETPRKNQNHNNQQQQQQQMQQQQQSQQDQLSNENHIPQDPTKPILVNNRFNHNHQPIHHLHHHHHHQLNNNGSANHNHNNNDLDNEDDESLREEEFLRQDKADSKKTKKSIMKLPAAKTSSRSAKAKQVLPSVGDHEHEASLPTVVGGQQQQQQQQQQQHQHQQHQQRDEEESLREEAEEDLDLDDARIGDGVGVVGLRREADEEDEEEVEEEEDEDEEGELVRRRRRAMEEGVGYGVVGGFWSRHSRPSSPRMPPPEQPELSTSCPRPRSRIEPPRQQLQLEQQPRYNNLGYWRARRVTFYRNGDPYFPGVEFRLVKMIIAKKSFPLIA